MNSSSKIVVQDQQLAEPRVSSVHSAIRPTIYRDTSTMNSNLSLMANSPSRAQTAVVAERKSRLVAYRSQHHSLTKQASRLHSQKVKERRTLSKYKKHFSFRRKTPSNADDFSDMGGRFDSSS